MNVNARATHYDPKVYEEPMKFNPSRFDVSYSSKASLTMVKGPIENLCQ